MGLRHMLANPVHPVHHNQIWYGLIGRIVFGATSIGSFSVDKPRPKDLDQPAK